MGCGKKILNLSETRFFATEPVDRISSQRGDSYGSRSLLGKSPPSVTWLTVHRRPQYMYMYMYMYTYNNNNTKL